MSTQHPGSGKRTRVSEDPISPGEPGFDGSSGDEASDGASDASDGPAGESEAVAATADRGWTVIDAKPWKLLVLLFSVAAFALVADIITKVVAVAKLSAGAPVRVLGGLVYLVLYRNPGAAFSLATGMTWLLALLAIGVVAVIIWLAPKLRSRGWTVGLGLVLGGALGNLVDRIFREPGPLQGHVVDFISLLSPDGSVWPVFNLADSAIVCGGALVVLMSLLGRDYDGTRPVRRSRRTSGGSEGTAS